MLDTERAARGDLRWRTERFGEAHLRILVERLVADEYHQILMPDVEEFLLERSVDRIAQINAQDFCPERGRQWPYGEPGRFFIECGGSRFHRDSRCFYLQVWRAALASCKIE